MGGAPVCGMGCTGGKGRQAATGKVMSQNGNTSFQSGDILAILL
jgi:hypothetical protein